MNSPSVNADSNWFRVCDIDVYHTLTIALKTEDFSLQNNPVFKNWKLRLLLFRRLFSLKKEKYTRIN
jgi:hypothetical protein